MPTVHARSLYSGRLLWDSVQAQWFLQGKQGHRLYPKEFSWSRNNLTTSTISSEWKLKEMVRSKNWHLMNILLLNQCDMVTCCVCMWLRECTCPVEFWGKKKPYGSRQFIIKSVNIENKMKSCGTEFHLSLEIISHDIYGTSPRKALVNAWHFLILIL